MTQQILDSQMPPRQRLFDRLGGRAKIALLLRHFYADVRQHNLIGPIFTAKIANWPEHLEKIADFWSGATGGPPLYRGGMPFKHIPLALNSTHFEAWLGLWRRNCQIYLLPPESDEMIAIAEAIGQRLHYIVTQHAGTQPG